MKEERKILRRRRNLPVQQLNDPKKMRLNDPKKTRVVWWQQGNVKQI